MQPTISQHHLVLYAAPVYHVFSIRASSLIVLCNAVAARLQQCTETYRHRLEVSIPLSRTLFPNMGRGEHVICRDWQGFHRRRGNRSSEGHRIPLLSNSFISLRV